MAGDASFASVALLLHGNGTNGSTTLTDSSNNARTVTVAGSAQISTATPKYGTGAISLNGSSGSYFQSGGCAFGTADFTVEWWVYITSLTSAPTLMDNRVVTPTASLVVYNTTGSTFSMYANGADRATGTIATAGYHHVAVCRASGVTRFFIDGVQQGSNYTDTNNYDHTTLRFGGNYSATNALNGFMDEVRVTPGAARYTANFTPPAAEFVNYAGQVAGVVTDVSGANASRIVRAYRRDTGALVGSATSDGTTGAYSINCPTLDEVDLIVLDNATSGTIYNDLIDRVIPA